MYGLSNGENIFDSQVTSKGQRSRSNPKNFEVEYWKSVRDRKKVSTEVR